MNNKIISILNKISKSKGLPIITNDSCEFEAKNDKDFLEVYYYKYTDETYDISFKSDKENVELWSINEKELLYILNKLK